MLKKCDKIEIFSTEEWEISSCWRFRQLRWVRLGLGPVLGPRFPCARRSFGTAVSQSLVGHRHSQTCPERNKEKNHEVSKLQEAVGGLVRGMCIGKCAYSFALEVHCLIPLL